MMGSCLQADKGLKGRQEAANASTLLDRSLCDINNLTANPISDCKKHLIRLMKSDRY